MPPPPRGCSFQGEGLTGADWKGCGQGMGEGKLSIDHGDALSAEDFAWFMKVEEAEGHRKSPHHAAKTSATGHSPSPYSVSRTSKFLVSGSNTMPI